MKVPALLLSLCRFKYSIGKRITHGRGSLGNAPRFSHFPGMALFRRFKTLSAKNGTTYRPGEERPLKRKNAGNNFFCKKIAKIMKKLLVIKK